jgi:hypothetical protein
MRTTGRACAEAAEKAAERMPPIYYEMEDCQAFVENTVKRAGGQIKNYRGSNDMYRNACTEVVPLKGAKLEPGMVLFIHDFKGGEPSRYKADGLGNAWHVGWYTGGRYEVVHSSLTKGMVTNSTLKNGWTHAGWLKGIEYDGQQEVEDEMNLKRGDKGDAVAEMQERLILLGYDLGKWGADGDFGADTEATVAAFQADAGLPVTKVWTDRERDKAVELLEGINDFPPANERRNEIIFEIRALLDELEDLP